MSKARCGFFPSPGYRCAHPGYALILRFGLLFVARMSEARCGFFPSRMSLRSSGLPTESCARLPVRSPHERSDMRVFSFPGCRCAHPGYALNLAPGFAFVARMSEATCGFFRPGYRCAHPGYAVNLALGFAFVARM